MGIKLRGAQLIDQKRMKQSRLRRIVLELTEEDSLRWAEALAGIETREELLNVKLTPIGSQNDVVTEKNTLVGTGYYPAIKRFLVEYGGESYYNEFKMKVQINHLSDLEKIMPLEEVRKFLNSEKEAVLNRIYGKDEQKIHTQQPPETH